MKLSQARSPSHTADALDTVALDEQPLLKPALELRSERTSNQRHCPEASNTPLGRRSHQVY